MKKQDIVAELRDWASHESLKSDTIRNLFLEASDEIRRLRRWKGEAIEVLVQWDSLCGRTLKALRIGERKTDAMAAYIDAQEAEIERLRAALALAVGELSTYGPMKYTSPEQLMQHFLQEARRD